MLELSAAIGEIDLKYMDESGFCAWSSLLYSYYFRGNKNVQNKASVGVEWFCIIGFLQPLISFVYGLVIGGVSRKSYIQMMEIEAAQAQKCGRIRVIVQDQGQYIDAKKYSNYGPRGQTWVCTSFFYPNIVPR